MKTTIGGDRIGSGQKMQVSNRHYNRSSHDKGALFRTSMSAGTLVPFLVEIGLPGDRWDINLNLEALTLPTIAPLFGTAKIQCDVFEVPIRLYNKALQLNKLNVGRDMSNIYLPQIELLTNNHANYVQTFEDNEQINPSSLMKYLGISGLGKITGTTDPANRQFNAVPLLAYWDIYKNFYANKQEEVGYCIHNAGTWNSYGVNSAVIYEDEAFVEDILDNATLITGSELTNLRLQFGDGAPEPDYSEAVISINGNNYTLEQAFASVYWDDTTFTLYCETYKEVETGNVNWEFVDQSFAPLGGVENNIDIASFDLTKIDDMREAILNHPYAGGAFVIESTSGAPYALSMVGIGTGADKKYSVQFSQESLGLKTYQSDLFNNWIDTDWIDGVNGVNAITAVSTAGDSFTIDALNLAQKLYDLQNRIAVSGGTYDDWLQTVYDHERPRGVTSPIYHGSLIKELAFQEVVATTSNVDTEQPLGELAGRGRLTPKNKGGKVVIKVNEPSVILGIVSITPRIDYSQGNKWFVNLKNYDEFHKPALDQIGFQDLITEQMCWTASDLDSSDGSVTHVSAGKQPAWINYMTSVNEVYGNFADENKEMMMVFNRRYEKDLTTGQISDLTTYIDPRKFNYVFAQTELDAQNYWIQISKNITARRKMSAKIMPNI